MRFVFIGLLATIAAASAEPWKFGDPVDIEREGANWSEISVAQRRPHLAETFTEPRSIEVTLGTTGPRSKVVEHRVSELLERPDELADLRDGKSWDETVDRFGFWDAVTMHDGTPGLGAPEKGDIVAMMFCTVYYTPLETGFTADRGFDMTLETRTGLGGRKYTKDFLRAVSVEGFGRLAEPYKGNRYIKYDGRWGYSDRILGNRNNTLVDRKSAAVYRRNPALPKNTKLTILDPDVFNALGSLEWNTADTGGGLKYWQIDLYWGEDVPLGTGMDRFRPKACPFAVKFWLPVRISKP